MKGEGRRGWSGTPKSEGAGSPVWGPESERGFSTKVSVQPAVVDVAEPDVEAFSGSGRTRGPDPCGAESGSPASKSAAPSTFHLCEAAPTGFSLGPPPRMAGLVDASFGRIRPTRVDDHIWTDRRWANVGQFGPMLTSVGPKPISTWPSSAMFGPVSVQIRPASTRFVPKSNKTSGEFGQFWQTPTTFVRIRPTLGPLRPTLAKFGRIRHISARGSRHCKPCPRRQSSLGPGVGERGAAPMALCQLIAGGAVDRKLLATETRAAA